MSWLLLSSLLVLLEASPSTPVDDLPVASNATTERRFVIVADVVAHRETEGGYLVQLRLAPDGDPNMQQQIQGREFLLRVEALPASLRFLFVIDLGPPGPPRLLLALPVRQTACADAQVVRDNGLDEIFALGTREGNTACTHF
jgi:hypothetical protein